jgi:HSP20 family protein
MKITDLIPWRSPGRDVTARTAAKDDPMQALQLDVDRAFDHFWSMVPYPFASFGQLAQTELARVDVSDNGKEITVTAELPGMSDADVDVSVRDGQLAIRGEKKSDREAEDNGALVKERIFGAIERTVPLPDGVDADAAKATFTNGVLTVVIPKSAELQAATKRIPVQAG